MKTRFICICSLWWSCMAFAQVGINTTTPQASAELEVSSTNKGVLIPRLTTIQMNAIASPANALLVYNLDQKQFYFYNAAKSKWMPSHISTHGVVSDSDGDTKIDIDVAGNGSDNKIHFYANADGNKTLNGAADKVAILDSTNFVFTAYQPFKINTKHVLSTKTSNTVLGNRTTIASGVIGLQNTFLGDQSGNSNTSGSGNTFLGASAGANGTSLQNNTFIGANAAQGTAVSPQTGTTNVVVGSNAASQLRSTADGNTIIGYNTASSITTGKANIIIGNNSGLLLATGDSNIVIGNNLSLANAATSHSLTIGNVLTSDSAYHLRGNISFSAGYTFPDLSGVQDQTLVIGNDGNHLTWANKTTAGQSAMTVTGASTDMKPFSRLAAGDVYTQQNNEVYYIPVIAMSNGDISKITTFMLANTGTSKITAALMVDSCGANTYCIASQGTYSFVGSTSTTATSGYVTIDFFSNDNDNSGSADQKSYHVNVGRKYVIALYSNNTTTKYHWLNDADNKGHKGNLSAGAIPNSIVINPFGAELIWARAH